MGTVRRARPQLAVAVAVLLTLSIPTTHADDKVPLGGGAGIAVGGTLCTLTTVGHDGTGALVGFTSAHCGGPGSRVSAEGGPVVGSVVAADPDFDYAVIKFDSAKVTPVPDFDGFPINGITGDPPPGQSQWSCQQSRASGHSCAEVIGSVSIDLRPPNHDTSPRRERQIRVATSTFEALECQHPGDDGAPVTVNNLLVGMIRGGFTPSPADAPCPRIGVAPPIPFFDDPPMVVSITAILNEVNANGGPGAGFVPVGAA